MKRIYFKSCAKILTRLIGLTSSQIDPASFEKQIRRLLASIDQFAKVVGCRSGIGTGQLDKGVTIISGNGTGAVQIIKCLFPFVLLTSRGGSPSIGLCILTVEADGFGTIVFGTFKVVLLQMAITA